MGVSVAIAAGPGRGRPWRPAGAVAAWSRLTRWPAGVPGHGLAGVERGRGAVVWWSAASGASWRLLAGQRTGGSGAGHVLQVAYGGLSVKKTRLKIKLANR